LAAEFGALGAQRVGVSSDDVETQSAFANENDLDFLLLSDRGGAIGKQFGTKRIAVKYLRRMTFVIDTDKTLIGKIVSETDMARHADEALEILRAKV